MSNEIYDEMKGWDCPAASVGPQGAPLGALA